MRSGVAAALLITASGVLAQSVVTRGTNLHVDVSAADGSFAMDLLGRVWTLPPAGGAATERFNSELPAQRPRWSPDGLSILFQTATAGASQIWLLDLATGELRRLNASASYEQHPDWHPSGERIVFSSDRRGVSLDLWEADTKTGLEWQLSHHPGDETEPAWSANGRHLVYVLREGDHWSLMLRRFGQPETTLVRSDSRLAAPSWRPDGTLITYFQKADTAGYELKMIILSEPPLERTLISGEDFALSPIRWTDRERLVYVADGRILTRGLDDWNGRTVPFRASVAKPPPRRHMTISNRELPVVTPNGAPLVIRARRLFDGFASAYRYDADVLIEGGLIAQISDRRDWEGHTVLDLGDVTLMPGLVDAFGALPDAPPDRTGARMLSWGVTTLASPDPWRDPATDAEMWEGEEAPGPRLLTIADLASDSAPDQAFLGLLERSGTASDEELRGRVAAWQSAGTPVLATNWANGVRLGAAAAVAADGWLRAPGAQPVAGPSGGSAPVFLVSGIADIATDGVAALFDARQARQDSLDAVPRMDRRLPEFRASGVVPAAASRPNGLPPGLALHAELRGLKAAGLPGHRILKSAGIDAARILGLSGKIGEISPGARADLLLVAGDPLGDVADTVNIVAVVRNGRFLSLVALLERAN